MGLGKGKFIKTQFCIVYSGDQEKSSSKIGNLKKTQAMGTGRRIAIEVRFTKANLAITNQESTSCLFAENRTGNINSKFKI